jgi:methyl-accepting chemotaxis protein
MRVLPSYRVTNSLSGIPLSEIARYEIPNTTRRDELGEMARAVEIFNQAAIENGRLRVVTARTNGQDPVERSPEVGF